MNAAILCSVLALANSTEFLAPGNYTRTVQADGRERSYLVHIPKKYDAKNPTPVVLILHGAWTNGPITALYSGLNGTADDNNFIAVYPNGTGLGDTALFWNCGYGTRLPIAGCMPPNNVEIGRAHV